jgi:hypothetical protein
MQVEAEEEFLTNGLQVKLEKVPPPQICRILFPLHICRTLYHLHICTISLKCQAGFSGAFAVVELGVADATGKSRPRGGAWAGTREDI